MIFLYNVGIFFASALIRFASLFNDKAKLFVHGRKGIFNELRSELTSNNGPLVWVHCASLGEFEQGRPVMEQLKALFPSIKILLTFFSPSGYEIRKSYPQADYIFYLPWDTRSNAKEFVTIARPALAIFVKYEFWYHYSQALRDNNVPLISVSAIFRPGQLFFQSYGKFYRSVLRNFSIFFVQNNESRSLLKSIGIDKIIVAGDTRFDRVFKVVNEASPIEIAQKFKSNEKLMVVGSCWEEDLNVLIPFINEQKLKFIIAPHEVSDKFINELEGALQVKSVRYSQAENKKLEEYSVLIIDNIGMLSRLYRYGEFAFVGGAFGKGLHNILEAACYGVPIFFGNRNYEKFQEAVDLINRGGAFAVQDFPDMKEKFELLNIPESFLLACEVTRLYVEENLGATDRVMNYCSKILQEKV